MSDYWLFRYTGDVFENKIETDLIMEKIKMLCKKIYFLLKYRKKHLKLHRNVNIGIHSEFEGYNVIKRDSSFVGKMGICSYIGSDCSIEGSIGRFCSIGNDVKSISGTHPINGYISTSPVFYSTRNQCGISFVKKNMLDESSKGVTIGNDVWICSGAKLMDGIIVGDGSVIGAGAIVTKNVPPYAVVAGVPAKVIKYRFSEERIQELLKRAWWNLPFDVLRRNVEKFQDEKEYFRT